MFDMCKEIYQLIKKEMKEIEKDIEKMKKEQAEFEKRWKRIKEGRGYRLCLNK